MPPCYVATFHSSMPCYWGFDWQSVCSFIFLSSFSFFLMLQVKLGSQPHCLHKQEAASEHLLLLVHVSRRRLHTRQVSFSSLSLHFHILSHLELGDTHRCGEHFCTLPYWTSSPLQLPSSHKFRPLVPLPLTVNSEKMKPMQSPETYDVLTGYLRLSRVSLHSLIVEMNIPTPWNVKEFWSL